MTRLAPASRAEMPLTLSVEASGDFKQPDATASTGDLWRIFWRRRVFIASTVSVLLALALVYGVVAKPLYTASAQIIVDPRDRQVIANDVNPSSVSPDGGITQVESQVQVIQSSSVLLPAIAATDLTHDPEFTRSGVLARLRHRIFSTLQPEGAVKPKAAGSGVLARLANFSTDIFSTPQPEEGALETETLRSLKQRLSVTRAEKVFVINVYVTANTAGKAARIANAIADAYLTDQEESKRQAGQKATAALMAGLDEQRSRVETLDNQIQAYRTSNHIIVANGNIVGDQRLIDFTSQLTAVQSRAAALKAKLDTLREANSLVSATPEALQSPVISHLREQEGALVQRQTEMESRFGPQYPAVVPVRAQLASIRALIELELTRISTSMAGEYVRAVTDERLLSVELERAKAETLRIQQASVQLRELERDFEATRIVYAAFLARANETRQQMGIDTTNARIITRATPPLQKSWPPLTILVLGAIGAGIGLGSGIALVREYVTPTILSRGQVERIVGAPVIAMLPPAVLRIPRSIQRKGAREDDPHVLAVLGLCLRRIFKVDVDGTLREKTGLRTLLITSGEQDAGVRKEVCNLFASAAIMHDYRVLLVDADMAGGKPGPTAGLLDIVFGERTLSSLVDVAPPSGVACLGKGLDQRLSNLGNRGWSGVTRMLSEARHHFDLVVIDGGTLAENPSIAPLLSAADEVLFVGQLARTKQNDVVGAADAATVMSRPISAILLVDPMARS